MADIALATADASGFIPIIWAQRALDVLRNHIRIARICARDTDFTPAERGKAITIPYPGTFTANKLASGGTTNVQTPENGNSVTVNLNEMAYVDFIVDDFARAQASMDLLDRYIQPAMIAIAEQLETDLWTLYASFTGGSVGTAGTNLVRSVITAAKTALDNAKAPQADRHVVFSTKDEAAILNDSTLQTYFAFARNEGIEEGAIAKLDGFTLWMSQLVPTTGADPVATQNIAFHKNAILLATRPLLSPDAGSGVAAATLVDEESGLAIRVLKQYNMDQRGHRVGFDILYGFTALRPNQGVNVLA